MYEEFGRLPDGLLYPLQHIFKGNEMKMKKIHLAFAGVAASLASTASFAIDVSAAVSSIMDGITAVELIGVAVLTVCGAVAVVKLIKRVL